MFCVPEKLTPWLALPACYTNPVQRRRAGLVRTVLLLLVSFLTLLLLVKPWTRWLDAPFTFVLVGGIGVAGAAWVLLRRGHLTAAVYVTLAMALLLTTLTVWQLGALHSPAMSGYVLVIVLAALLGSRRMLTGVVVVSILIAFGLVQAEMNGLLEALPTLSGISVWVGYSVVFVITALLSDWGVLSYRRALENTQVELERRVQTEHALRAAQEKVEALFDTAPDAVYLLASDQTILEANAAGAARLGYTREAIQGIKVPEIMPPEVTPERTRHFKHALATGKPVTIQDARDGHWFESLMCPLSGTGDGKPWVAVYSRDITRQRAAEQALYESEQKFLKMFRSNPAVIILSRRSDGQILEVNDRWEQVFGYPRQDAVGRSSLALGLYVDEEARRRMVERLEADGTVQDMQVEIRTQAGEIRTISLSGEPITVAGEDCILSMVVDITERQAAEQALRKNQEHMRLATETTHLGIWEWNLKTNKIRWDAEMFRIYGIPPTADGVIDYADWASTLEPAELTRQEELLQETIRTQGQGQREFRIRPRDTGEPRVIYAVETVRLDASGEPEWVVGTNLDLTERKRTEEALRESEAKFAAAFRSAPLAIAIAGHDGRFVEVNDAYCALVGHERQEIVGKTIADVGTLSEAERLKLREVFMHAGGAVRDLELELHTRDGQVRSVVYSVNPITLKGKPHHLGVAMDLTERKRAEEKLRAHDELMHTVLENSSDGINLLDLRTGRYTFMSPAQVALTGFSVQEVNNFSEEEALARVHPDDRAISETQKQLIAGGAPGPWKTEYRWRVKSGEYRWFSDSRKLVRDPEGNPVALVGISRDITEQKAVEQALQESQALLHETERLGKVGGWAFDIRTGVQTWTPEVYRIHEVSPDYQPTVSKGIEFYAPEARDVIEAAVQRTVDMGEPFDLELPLITARNNPRWVHVIGRREPANSRVYGFFQDITERKNAEEALRASEALFHQMFDEHSAVMLLLDPENGAIVDANRAAETFYGYPRETLLTMRLEQINLLSPTEIAAHLLAIREHREKEFIVPHRLASGEIREVEVFAVPIDSPQGTRNYAIVHDVTERRQAEREILHLSTHDALTGVYNRAFFETEMERLSASRAFPISLLIADLDNMKETNDTHGHAVGDTLLKRTAQLLRETCRASDILARIGGDEFVALLPETDEAAAAQFVRRIRQALSGQNENNDGSRVELSIGIATTTTNDLLRTFMRADAAMYAEKRKHKRDLLPEE